MVSLTPTQPRRRRRETIQGLPEFEQSWLEQAVAKDEARLASLRQRDVEGMTDRLQDRMHQPERADKDRRAFLRQVEDGFRNKEIKDDEEAQKKGRAKSFHDARARLELAMILLKWYPEDQELRDHAAKLLVEAVQIEPIMNRHSMS